MVKFIDKLIEPFQKFSLNLLKKLLEMINNLKIKLFLLLEENYIEKKILMISKMKILFMQLMENNSEEKH